MLSPCHRRFRSALSLLAVAGGMALCRSARADERYWYFAGSTTFETYFNGAFAGPGYWFGFTVPGPGDNCHFSASGDWPGFPPPSTENPFGVTPRVVFFGDFNYHSFLGGAHVHRDAVNAVVERVYIHDGEYEFNFGSGVGGWAPQQPDPSQGSLRINQQTILADALGGTARLAIREGTLRSDGPVHIAPGERTLLGPSHGEISVSGPNARWGWTLAGSAQVSWRSVSADPSRSEEACLRASATVHRAPSV